MLKQLKIENFTVFAKADFEFSSGLNVIVGENGTGKSHVLKLAYAMIADNNAYTKKYRQSQSSGEVTKKSADYFDKLENVFRVESMINLIRAGLQPPLEAGVVLTFTDARSNCAFVYKQSEDKEFTLFEPTPPARWDIAPLVFIPTRELLTIYPGFVSLYEGRYLAFDETYRDTCLLLGEPLLKKPMTDLLAVLEEAMGGKVERDRDRFYLVLPDKRKMEMPLVAEGVRKLAMLAQLIAVGALQKDGYLFWDEPEANLNPRLIKVIARVILQLAKAGIQIFIATHSLFLLRELEVLQAAEKKPVPQRYFALKQTADGVEVEQGDAVEDLQTLVLLDEELQQSDRYMALEQ